MYANFTEETCTGTGATLALAGATSGNIPFSASFADGDAVAYVVEDSGGSIKVAGVGTYVSATDDITRNDTWNYNGTVVDKNPSTNIALSGGTHTVRCDVVASYQPATSSGLITKGSNVSLIKTVHANGEDGNVTFTTNPTQIEHMVHYVPKNNSINGVQFEVNTAVASSLTRVGLSSMDLSTGEVSKLLAESISLDTSTTGRKTGSFTSIYFPNDTLIFSWIRSDSAIGIQARDRTRLKPSHLYSGTSRNTDFFDVPSMQMPVASGAPAYPATVSPLLFSNVVTPDTMLLRG